MPQDSIDTWREIPGSDSGEEHRRYSGILSLYVAPAAGRGPRGKYREGFDHRWTIWAFGTLLGEGFTDSRSAAKSAAIQECDKVMFRIRTAVKELDVRDTSDSKKGVDD